MKNVMAMVISFVINVGEQVSGLYVADATAMVLFLQVKK